MHGAEGEQRFLETEEGDLMAEPRRINAGCRPSARCGDDSMASAIGSACPAVSIDHASRGTISSADRAKAWKARSPKSTNDARRTLVSATERLRATVLTAISEAASSG